MKGREKKELDVKKEASKVKPEVVDLLDECVLVVAEPAPVKAELKAELTEAQLKRKQERLRKREERAKKEQAQAQHHPKKDKKHKEDKEEKEKKRQRGRSRSKKRRSQERSGSSSSDGSSSSSTSDLYKKYKPYTKVRLINLVRRAELNGQSAQVVHPSVAVSPCPPGCVLVRLESGREIAVKPPHLRRMDAFHAAPQALSHEDRLQTVLRQIKHNVATLADPSKAGGEGSGNLCILDADGPQGGVGHLL
mmetsp:Transcript_73268/g.136933  ORF Transcript_73268/g.136933 Transcript_73268/m.136933 type:complete len:250 (+) Transcript_73268:137-886(+)